MCFYRCLLYFMYHLSASKIIFLFRSCKVTTQMSSPFVYHIDEQRLSRFSHGVAAAKEKNNVSESMDET